MNEETQIAKKPASIKELIGGEQFKQQLSLALPRHMTPDRFARIALTAMQRTPKLQDCTQTSLFKCLLDLSAMGLEPDGRKAHLIPYGTECTLVIDYKGLLELVRNSGDVTSIRAENVCANDKFSWVNGVIDHEVDWLKPRGEMLAVYAIATLKSGEMQTAVLTNEEVESIRKRSRSGNSGPWSTDTGEMRKKSALRRLCKLLPLSPEASEHIDRDTDVVLERDITPVPQAALKLPSQEVEAIQS